MSICEMVRKEKLTWIDDRRVVLPFAIDQGHWPTNKTTVKEKINHEQYKYYEDNQEESSDDNAAPMSATEDGWSSSHSGLRTVPRLSEAWRKQTTVVISQMHVELTWSTRTMRRFIGSVETVRHIWNRVHALRFALDPLRQTYCRRWANYWYIHGYCKDIRHCYDRMDVFYWLRERERERFATNQWRPTITEGSENNFEPETADVTTVRSKYNETRSILDRPREDILRTWNVPWQCRWMTLDRIRRLPPLGRIPLYPKQSVESMALAMRFISPRTSFSFRAI